MPPTRIASPETRAWLVTGIAALLAAVSNVASLGNGFVNWDDTLYVTENPFVQTLDPNLVRSAFLEFHAANWHPLTWISHALDVALWGHAPFGHHLTNLILHVLVTVVVARIALRLATAGSNGSGDSGALVGAGVAAALFATHPAHVESISWISQRKELLCALFYALAILAYMRGIAPDAGAGTRWRWMAFGFAALASLSKPTAVSIPVALLAIDYVSGHAAAPSRAVIDKWPFFLLATGLAVMTILAQSAGGAVSELRDYPLGARLLHVPVAYVDYLVLLIWPADLNPFRALPEAATGWPLALVATLVLAAITGLCVAQRKRARGPLAAWAFFVIALIPVIGIVQVGQQAIADRYLYIPSAAIFLLAGVAFGRAWTRRPRLRGTLTAAAALPLAVLGAASWNQHGVWQDGIRLWERVLASGSASPTPYAQSGEAYYLAGRKDDALRVLREGVERFPTNARIRNKLAILRLDAGDHGGAEHHARAAIAGAARDPEGRAGALNTLGEVHFARGEFEAALRYFSDAVTWNGRAPANRFNLALSLERTGRVREACGEWRRYLAIEGNPAEAARVREHIRSLPCGP